MNVDYVLPKDVPHGEWPDSIRVRHYVEVPEGEVRTERVMVYLPDRKAKRVIRLNDGTDHATGTCRCGSCGASIGQDDKFCARCGAEVCDA